jgi:hypothetical protein
VAAHLEAILSRQWMRFESKVHPATKHSFN